LNTTPGGPTPDPFADYPIAEEPACCNPFQEPEAFSAATSEPISLAAGEEYAFLVLMKDGGGDDYFYAAWRREGDTTPAASLPALAGPVIGAEVQAAGFEVAITRQPQAPSDTVEEGRSITLAAETEAGPNPDFLLYQ